MIPRELRTRRQWVVWKEQTRAGSDKPTKVPYRPGNPKVKASSTDDKTWGTYQEAKNVVRSGDADGVGFVFTDDDPYCGVDFDDVIDEAGIEKRVFETIKNLETYAEVSPSGKGVHVIGIAELKNGGKKSSHAEIYDRGRFFCMTGERLAGTKARIGQFDPDPVVRFIRNGKGSQASPKNQALGPPSRHDSLVSLAAQLVAAGATRDFITEALWAKAREIKLPKREDDEVGRIIEWALQQQGRTVRVAKRVETLKVNREADIILETELLGSVLELEDEETAVDELAQPDEDVEYQVDELIPAGANILLNAERKTGKTSIALTLTKALVDGEPFLGYFATQAPEGHRVLYLNYELTRNQFRRWMRRIDMQHPELLAVKHLRGTSLPFWIPEHRDRLVEYCKRMKIWCLIIDPQMMASRGIVDDENNNMQFAEFHHAIDTIKELAGISVSVVAHHIGKADRERGRGASRIEDWPDVLWYLTREDDGRRSMKAEGRDVDLQPIALTFNKESGLYSWDGSTRAESKSDQNMKLLVRAVLAIHKDLEIWPNQENALKQIHGTRTNRLKVLSLALDRGYLVKREGTSKKHGGRPPMRIQATELGRSWVRDAG